MPQQCTSKKTAKKSMGRPLGSSGKETQKLIDQFLQDIDRNFSTEDIRRVTKQSTVTVRNRLNALLKAKRIERVTTQKILNNGTPVRGRPQAIYRKLPHPQNKKGA